MANILLVDDSDVAARAMEGILARGNHACFVATKADQAWRMLREGVVFDLVFLELKIAGGGLPFLQRLRDDWLLGIIRVVVYTRETDSRLVRKALALQIQNYLIKPFSDPLVHGEIARAMKSPWRNLHFEDAESFCAVTGLSAETLTTMRREVMTGFGRAAQTFPAWAGQRQVEEVCARINELVCAAEAAGVWAAVDFLRDLQEQAVRGNWAAFKTCGEHLDFASRLIFCQLNPSYAPDCLRHDASRGDGPRGPFHLHVS